MRPGLEEPLSETAPRPLEAGELAARVESGHRITGSEALAILGTPDERTLELVAAAGTLRRKHFGNTVKVNYLVNLKSGLCPEDCTYCSQRLGSKAEILKYSWLKPEEAVHQAGLGIAAGVSRVCMVASGKGPSDRDVDRVATMIGQIKDEHPEIEVCACLGILKDGHADRLTAAGPDAYNHNLNTAESLYPEICSTHTFQERVDTVGQAMGAGLSPCSGLIVGMGETPEQLVEAAFALRELDADSIPVNFVMPFGGTPLAVALAGSRRIANALCAVAAAGAVAVLVRSTTSTDYLGVGLAMLAAVCWASYVLLNREVGARLPGLEGSAAAALVSGILFLPVGAWVLWQHPPTAAVLGYALAAGALSSAVPFLADLLALRRMPAHSFSMFMSVNPVFAPLIGLVALGQQLDALARVAIVVIFGANIVALSTAQRSRET